MVIYVCGGSAIISDICVWEFVLTNDMCIWGPVLISDIYVWGLCLLAIGGLP